MLVIDHPALRKRVENTYLACRARPREALERLTAVFNNDEEKVMAFVKAVNSRQDWRKAIGH